MFKIKLNIIFLLLAGVFFGLYILQRKEISPLENEVKELRIIKTQFVSENEELKLKTSNYKVEIEGLKEDIKLNSKKTYQRTISEDDSITFWYVSFTSGNRGITGYNFFKCNKSYYDPFAICNIIRKNNKFKDGQYVQILDHAQLTEVAYKHFKINQRE